MSDRTDIQLAVKVAVLEGHMNTSTYNAVWDGLLEVARAREYYFMQERRFQKHVYAVRFSLAVFGCGAVASLLDSFSWLAAVSGAAIAFLVIIDLLWDGTTRLSQLKVVNQSLSNLEVDYRLFWDRVRSGDIEGHDALEKREALLKALVEIASSVDIEANEKIRQEAQEHAFEAEAVRYAT
jgi:hypothetical protein